MELKNYPEAYYCVWLVVVLEQTPSESNQVGDIRAEVLVLGRGLGREPVEDLEEDVTRLLLRTVLELSGAILESLDEDLPEQISLRPYHTHTPRTTTRVGPLCALLGLYLLFSYIQVPRRTV